MLPIHKTLLKANEDFLLDEVPARALLRVMSQEQLLTSADLRQLSNLELQGSRAVTRYLLYLLPSRGPLAFPTFLHALQTVNAQHLVDLLLEEEKLLLQTYCQVQLPLTAPHKQKEDEENDPHEYARRLKTNMMHIRQAVNPVALLPDLLQAGVLSEWEGHLLQQSQGQTENAWTVVMGAVLQRGQTAYKAFGAALLQHGYSTVFDTIHRTQVSTTHQNNANSSATSAGDKMGVMDGCEDFLAPSHVARCCTAPSQATSHHESDAIFVDDSRPVVTSDSLMPSTAGLTAACTDNNIQLDEKSEALPSVDERKSPQSDKISLSPDMQTKTSAATRTN